MKRKKALPGRASRQTRAHTPHVAVLLWHSDYGQDVKRGIARYATTHGPWAFFSREEDAFEPLPRLEEWDGDGIIAPINNEDFAGEIRAAGLAAVSITAASGFPVVTGDNASIGRLAAEHLIKQGYQHFGYFGASDGIFSQQRRDAFVKTIRRAGLEGDVSEPSPCGRMPHKWRSVQKLLVRWLRSLPKPIGVMACSDGHGRQVIEAARTCGILVPEEVAVIGVNNNEMMCEFCNPPLSSVLLQGRQIGYKAARLLDRLMAGGAAPKKPILIPPVEVVVRQSSDMLAAADEDLAAAVRFIREHGNKAISVTDVLDKIAISRRSLEQRFSNVVGHTPWREIRIAQIAHVKKLLSQTNMPVTRIAAASAFSNPIRLCRIFKEETKMTPTAYRRKSAEDAP